jgi:hypothetical protein
MGETLGFYERLGFRVIGCHPFEEDPTWAEVQRDDVTLQFHTEPPPGTPPLRCAAGRSISSREASWSRRRSCGTRSSSPGGLRSWITVLRELGIRDPNGYDLAFSEPA